MLSPGRTSVENGLWAAVSCAAGLRRGFHTSPEPRRNRARRVLSPPGRREADKAFQTIARCAKPSSKTSAMPESAPDLRNIAFAADASVSDQPVRRARRHRLERKARQQREVVRALLRAAAFARNTQVCALATRTTAQGMFFAPCKRCSSIETMRRRGASTVTTAPSSASATGLLILIARSIATLSGEADRASASEEPDSGAWRSLSTIAHRLRFALRAASTGPTCDGRVAKRALAKACRSAPGSGSRPASFGEGRAFLPGWWRGADISTSTRFTAAVSFSNGQTRCRRIAGLDAHRGLTDSCLIAVCRRTP